MPIEPHYSEIEKAERWAVMEWILVGRRLWQILRHGEFPQDAPALAAMAALGGLAVHSQVDYFLAYTQVAVIVWPLVGLACGALDFSAPAATGTAHAAPTDASAAEPDPERPPALGGAKARHRRKNHKSPAFISVRWVPVPTMWRSSIMSVFRV